MYNLSKTFHNGKFDIAVYAELQSVGSHLINACMKKTLLLICILLFISGCSPLPSLSSSPDKVVKNGLKNLIGVTSYDFDLSVSGYFDALQGAELVKFSLDGQLSGEIDSNDPIDPKLSVSVSGTGAAGTADPQSLSGEIRVNKENAFFKVSALPSLSEAPLPQEFVDQFVNKWWQVPVPEGTYTKDNPLFGFSGANQEELDKYKDLIDKHSFFADLKDEGTEVVKGDESYKYSARLDKDGLKGFLMALRKISGVEMTSEEISALDDMLNSTTFTGYVYVGIQSEKLNKISGDLYIKDVSEEQVKEGNLKISSSVWDFGKPVSLTIPEEYELFNPFMLLGAPAVPDEGAGS